MYGSLYQFKIANLFSKIFIFSLSLSILYIEKIQNVFKIVTAHGAGILASVIVIYAEELAW